MWRRRVESYWNLLSPKIETDTIRNVMDMKANMGSFGAALKDKDVWVMNVVPEDGPNTLKLIYDRGLIGTTNNWYAAKICTCATLSLKCSGMQFYFYLKYRIGALILDTCFFTGAKPSRHTLVHTICFTHGLSFPTSRRKNAVLRTCCSRWIACSDPQVSSLSGTNNLS